MNSINYFKYFNYLIKKFNIESFLDFKNKETETETKPVATVEAAPSLGSVPSWVWLALLVGAGAVWYMVR